MVITTACRRRNVRHPGSYRRQKHCHGLCQIWLSQEGDTSRSRGAEEGSSGCCHTVAFHPIEVLERLKWYKADIRKTVLVVYLLDSHGSCMHDTYTLLLNSSHQITMFITIRIQCIIQIALTN
jgi:hypothetical protein